MKFSNRILGMQYSPIRKLVPLIDKAKKEGVTVYELHIGQPDVKTPDTFFEGLNNFKEKIVKYANSAGLAPNSRVPSFRTSSLDIKFRLLI